MEENRQSQQHNKKYNTVFGLMMHGLFMVSLLSLSAWFLLMIWFIGKIYFQNTYLVSHEISFFVEKYTQFVYLYHHSLVDKVVTGLVQVQNMIQQVIVFIFEKINQGVKVIYPASISINQHVSSDISMILFGVIEIVLLRLLIFILNCPLFISLLFLAVVDGLGQRDIRKHNGSRESTFFFHRAKPLIGKIFFITFLIYMSIPFVLNPTIILLPMIFLLSANMMLSVKSYKKYV